MQVGTPSSAGSAPSSLRPGLLPTPPPPSSADPGTPGSTTASGMSGGSATAAASDATLTIAVRRQKITADMLADVVGLDGGPNDSVMNVVRRRLHRLGFNGAHTTRLQVPGSTTVRGLRDWLTSREVGGMSVPADSCQLVFRETIALPLDRPLASLGLPDGVSLLLVPHLPTLVEHVIPAIGLSESGRELLDMLLGTSGGSIDVVLGRILKRNTAMVKVLSENRMAGSVAELLAAASAADLKSPIAAPAAPPKPPSPALSTPKKGRTMQEPDVAIDGHDAEAKVVSDLSELGLDAFSTPRPRRRNPSSPGGGAGSGSGGAGSGVPPPVITTPDAKHAQHFDFGSPFSPSTPYQQQTAMGVFSPMAVTADSPLSNGPVGIGPARPSFVYHRPSSGGPSSIRAPPSIPEHEQYSETSDFTAPFHEYQIVDSAELDDRPPSLRTQSLESIYALEGGQQGRVADHSLLTPPASRTPWTKHHVRKVDNTFVMYTYRDAFVMCAVMHGSACYISIHEDFPKVFKPAKANYSPTSAAGQYIAKLMPRNKHEYGLYLTNCENCDARLGKYVCGTSPTEERQMVAVYRQEIKYIHEDIRVRSMSMAIPNVLPCGVRFVWCPRNPRGGTTRGRSVSGASSRVIRRELETTKEEEIKLNSLLPAWSEASQGLTLEFVGRRIACSSSKNFLLLQDDLEVLQFGKMEQGLYALDFGAPVSPLQAFGALLSAFVGWEA